MLSPFGTLNLDQGTFVAWSNILASGGFKNFYNTWSDYLPGYMYVLWLLGKINSFNLIPQELLYKLPAIISDILTGGVIYLILRKYVKEKIALISASLYIFNPAILANSTLWGQVDSLTALFSLLSIWLAGINPFVSSMALAIGTSIKPQAALAAGVILFIIWRDKWEWKKILGYGLLGSIVFILIFIPFAQDKNLILFVYERILATLNQYPYSSINAFNFWGLLGFWKPEGNGIFSANLVGVSFTLILYLVAFLKLKDKKLSQYKLAAILFLASFLFFSRMHERHMLFAFTPLTIISALHPFLWIPYIGLSLTYIANLYYSYVWINESFKVIFTQHFIKFFIVANLLLLFFIIKEVSKVRATKIDLKFFDFLKSKNRRQTVKFPPANISNNKAKVYLGIILGFSFLSRLLFLNHPEKEYFDEVYHAFTAKIILHGDPKAWEWWNPHPEGYAYEWTHPPLAKEGMVLGMSIWGENSFGWRFPGAILGVGSVFLIYLIAKKLFKDEGVALLSAGAFSLDGLPLVMSRIGMNDSYLLFFVLLSIYAFFKDRNFLSALFFGLALSSKWSALWSIPIFLLGHFVLKKKFRFSYFWFVILPPLVYLASYLPMFLTGHTFDIFIGMQRQMWWYHTNLEATHPYTSMWYSWPLLIRPIWLYTDVLKDRVENIYAMGNPAVFWSGLTSVIISFYYAFKERSKNLALVVFSYLIFFVPWAASPRIMFFYHYLPSIPFLAIATGFVLRKNPKLINIFFIASFILFVYFFPHWTGITVSKALDTSYYWFNSWR
jgi:dolichyl-phosphate-mannose-protein mannosyltransferase